MQNAGPPPESYANLSLPALKLSHHPPTAPTATPIILVSLHRPEVHNAFNNTMMLSLERAFALLSADPRVKCIVLTGSDPTNRIFCAGMELNPDILSTSAAAADVDAEASRLAASTATTHRDGGGRVSLAIFRCPKPVIAALNGSAVGIGATMTLPCAIRVTHTAARVGFVFARRGLVLEGCSSFFLPRLLGTSRALHLATTGGVYPVTDPLLDGLFTLVDDPAQVVPRALAIAEDVARNASVVSTVMMRDMMYRGAASPEGAHLLESRILFDLFSRPDFVEGVKAFVEKKEPVLVGEMPRDAPGVWPWWEDELVKAKEKEDGNGNGGKAKL
ncbi:ClpP/crotonase-like domain-containing protein [Coniella lustricola]|uniref:ClpP/crotonase-like domain-containing protein n=1 Tax=Coniella lustricola TaxID=2025994 RepID=A0A2T3AFK6_9PEZI|nr:ClpP/crotonase-like domain-containing protein [Coniella lustricola]